MSLLFPPKVALVLPLKPCSLPWQVSVVTVSQYVVAKVRTFAEMTKKMPRLFIRSPMTSHFVLGSCIAEPKILRARTLNTIYSMEANAR